MKLSERVARLEQRVAAGELSPRDLEVILKQIARAEAKLLAVLQHSRKHS